MRNATGKDAEVFLFRICTRKNRMTDIPAPGLWEMADYR